MDIRDRVAIVTGAASGTGKVIADHLADLGAVVVVADAAEAGPSLPRRVPVQADLLTEAGLDAILKCAERLGGPHILVNNAGGWGTAGRNYPSATPEEWRAVLELNLLAPMALTQRCLPAMTRLGGGAVVNIASSAGRESQPYSSPEYGAAKAALIRFSTAFTDDHVRVNCVVPGWIGLERAEAEVAAMSPEQRAELPPLIPPEEVAAAVSDLITDDSLSGRIAVLEGGVPRRLLAS
jgi:NAD(P)-dependent dehydrogenase (short-subunit alcohol dehydrogenase family)